MSVEFSVRPIGYIRSSLQVPSDAPKQGHDGAPDAWLDVDPDLVPALTGISVGDALVVLTWFHQADRATLQVHPRDDARNPLTGVFKTRSADRPNPIGLHPVRVLALNLDEGRLQIGPIEAIDGTPVIDLKPQL